MKTKKSTKASSTVAENPIQKLYQSCQTAPALQVDAKPRNSEVDSETWTDCRLKLPKLRNCCSFKVVHIFNRLNDDILDELSLK
jgi:hypothetical protein